MGGAALPVSMGIGALGSLLGGGQGRTNMAVPGQLRGLQGSQIDLLNSLIPGFGGGQGGNALGPLRNYFGNIGVPQTDLQRQSLGGMSQFLNAGSPAMSAMNTALPVLQGMMTGTGPQFERDISLANQQGTRFGSANAVMRGEALRNLFNMRNQTAGTIGMLGQQQASELGQGFGMGQQEAQQSDIGLQRLLSLFGGLMGLRQQMVAGLPITQQPSFGQQFGQFGAGLESILPFLFGGGGMGGPQNAALTSFLPGVQQSLGGAFGAAGLPSP